MFLVRLLQIALGLCVVLTSAGFVGLYLVEGETDSWGETVGPPKPQGVVGAALLGVMAWWPLLGLLLWQPET